MKPFCPKCHKHLASHDEPYLHEGEWCQTCDPERKTARKRTISDAVLDWAIITIGLGCLGGFIHWLSLHLRWVP